MKQLYALLFILCAVVGSRNAMGQNPTYAPATSLLTLPVVDVEGGITYNSVVVRLDSIAVISVGSSTPTGVETVTQDGLIWTKLSITAYTWEQANAYCNTAYFNGETGWRLPSQPEITAFRVPDGTMGVWYGEQWSNRPDVNETSHYSVYCQYTSSGASACSSYSRANNTPLYFMCVR